MAAEASLDGLAMARIAVYRFALQTLDKPSAEQLAWMSSPAYCDTLTGLCASFGLEPPVPCAVAGTLEDHEAQYIAWFEVGVPTPPVVLHASHYQRTEPSPRIIHEHVLYYRRFGAALTERNIDQADHLLNQLAFLIHLDELAALARDQTAAIEAARCDFLQRRVLPLLSNASTSARSQSAPWPYADVLRLLAVAAEQDLGVSQQGRAGRDGGCLAAVPSHGQ